MHREGGLAADRRIGVIGLGMMGRGIAGNLLRKGFEVAVLGRRSRDGVEAALAQGAVEAASPEDIARRCDAVLICVPGSPQVEAVVYGEDGLLRAMAEGTLLIDCSTIRPETTLKVAADLEPRGVAVVDAPLARTPVEAEAGTLNTMVGATPEAFARARPILEAFCEKIFHVGPPGAGQKVKLLNNFLTMGQAAIIAEALVACTACGVDVAKYYEVISAGGGNSGIFQMIAGGLVKDGTVEGMRFGLTNAEKDLRYFVDMAGAAHLTAALGKRVHLSLLEAVRLGYADRLVGALVEVQEQLNNVAIPRTGA